MMVCVCVHVYICVCVLISFFLYQEHGPGQNTSEKKTRIHIAVLKRSKEHPKEEDQFSCAVVLCFLSVKIIVVFVSCFVRVALFVFL